MKKYTLTHLYAINKEEYNVNFESQLSMGELFEIIAYIQFITDDIKHAEELSAIEIFGVLKTFYDDSIVYTSQEGDYIIDEHQVWESLCGKAEQIMGNEKFYRENLIRYINQLLANRLNYSE